MARVEAEKANPQADVIWGVFNDYLTGAANKGLLDGYQAKESGGVATMFRHPQNLWQGVTLVTVAFAVNQKKMQDLKLTPPRSWEDLLDPKYKGHIVMSNPSTSGTAYLLLASHAARLGEDKLWQYHGNSEVSDSARRQSHELREKIKAKVWEAGLWAPHLPREYGGMGLDFLAHAYMNEVLAFAYEVDVARKQGAPIDVIYPTDGVAWTFEGNALVKGTKNPQNGRRFLDWAMSRSAMDAYVKWRGSGITRPDISVTGAKVTDLKLIPLDFVWAAEQKDRLVKKWLEKFSR